MVDRIKHVMEYYEETPAGFAEKVGVNRSNLTHLFTGRNQPSLDVARKILAKFPEISTEWLIMGMGDMFRTDNQEVQPSQPSPEEAVNEQHLAENAKIMQQVDLFGEYVPQNDSEEDVVAPRYEQTEEPSVMNAAAETVVSPQPMPTPEPVTAPVQQQVSRVRTKPAPAPMKRDKNMNAVQERKLQKIIFFYDDHSFEVYNA